MSHSSTEAEVISSDTCLKMEGLLALASWDIVIDVLELLVIRAEGDPSRQLATKTDNNSQESFDFDPPNAPGSSNRAQLFTFGNNDVVIKMVVKGRSPHMRHVSRPHRVNLDWLFLRESIWVRTFP